MSKRYNSIEALTNAGIAFDDATDLRRISMTLHRWHELECGTDSACVVRGKWNRETMTFDYDDNGAAYLEFAGGSGKHRYSKIADRERGALRRLESIMKRYPDKASYVQGDPRGAALYILDKATTPQPYDQFYSRGIVVCK